MMEQNILAEPTPAALHDEVFASALQCRTVERIQPPTLGHEPYIIPEADMAPLHRSGKGA